MNNEQNKILWEVLRPNAKSHHHYIDKNNRGSATCVKCGGGNDSSPCSAFDQFPGSPADVAEEIQDYIQKNFNKQQNTEYLRILTKRFNMTNTIAKDIGGVELSELYFGAQLLRSDDKIKAFTEAVGGMT